MSDSVNEHYFNDEKFQQKLKNTIKIDDADASRYSAIFFAGGHGTMWDFAVSEGIQKVTKEIYENGGVVSAVCHGPAALVNVTLSDDTYLVDGKKISCFYQ